MGRYIQKNSKVIAEASLRENVLIETLKSETDSKALRAAAVELAKIREVKGEAKSNLISNETEFECALHLKDGLPAVFNSTERVVIEVSAAYAYEKGVENPTMYNFRKRYSYLVVCAKCAKKYKIVENLTDTLEEKTP